MNRLLCACILLLASPAAPPSLAAITATGDINPATDPSTWTSSTTAYVGTSATGALAIDGGSGLLSASTKLGLCSGSSGTVTIDGAGSNWNNSSDLYVGYSGTGTLNISNGGAVSALGVTSVGGAEFWRGGMDLESMAIGTGTINFGASGGTLTTGMLYASPDQLTGSGTVNTQGLVSDLNLVFDSTHGLKQTITLNSLPSQNVTVNLDQTNASYKLGAGWEGNGSLTVRDGLTVSSTYGTLGCNPGSTGTATVSGNSSTWTMSSGLCVGSLGTGALAINNGGTVSSGGGEIGNGAQLSPTSFERAIGTVSVDGAGSKWTNSGNVTVGCYGHGTLTVTNGGAVSSTGSCVLGGCTTSDSNYGATGTVAVDGPGSALSAGGGLIVGQTGKGTLTVTNGGTVTSAYGYVGDWHGSTGVATVDGPGSTWINTGDLVVCTSGYDTRGTLNITNGGAIWAGNTTWIGSNIQTGTIDFGAAGGSLTTGSLAASPSQLRGTGTVNARTLLSDIDLVFDRTQSLKRTIAFTALQNQNVTLNLDLASDPSANGVLGAGWTGRGSLTIRNGITVSSASGYLGYNSGSTGVATVDGAGSTWTNSGVLYVGYSGAGTLAVTNGGTVNSDWGFVGYDYSSKGTVTVDGTGSTWTNSGPLYFGGQQYSGGSVDGTLNIDGGGAVTAASVHIIRGSQLTIDVGRGSSLTVGGGSGTINGSVRFVAGASVAAGRTYSPISAGTWNGASGCQAVGGTWNANTRVFTVSNVVYGAAGTPVSISANKQQRLLISDASSGNALGVSFLATSTSSTIGLTASPPGSDVLASLVSRLSGGESVLSGWTLSTTGYTAGDPAYLSFLIGGGYSRNDLDVWSYNAGAWTAFTASDLTFDGLFASFTATALNGYGYAITGVAILPGDVNRDGKVDIIDLNAVLTNYDRTTAATWANGDFNNDGRVDINDLSVVLLNYDRSAGAPASGLAAVPEPGTLILLVVGVLGLLGCARRIGR